MMGHPAYRYVPPIAMCRSRLGSLLYCPAFASLMPF
jgi:hypothetical protein